MQPALKLIPVASCAIALIYLALAVFSSHDLVKAAHATIALAFAVVPYLAVKVVHELLGKD